MNPSVPPRPPWRSFADALRSYRHGAVEPTLRALCEFRARVTARQGGAQRDFRARLDDVLRPALGAWYGRGWSVFDDVFSFRNHGALAAVDQLPNASLGPPGERVRMALGVLRRRVAALAEVVRCCDAPDGAPRTAAGAVIAPARALTALDRVAPRSDGWPALAADLTGWALEAHGVAPRHEAPPLHLDPPTHTYAARYDAAMRLVAAATDAPLAALAAERPWAARILRPALAGEARARDAVVGIRSAKEAWETLAARGVIPDAWVGARSFSSPSRRLAYPPSVEGCVRLAADVPGVLRAEALAAEALARLRPWGAIQTRALGWYLAKEAALPPQLNLPEPLATLVELTDFYTSTRPLENPYELAVWRDGVASHAALLRDLEVAFDASDEAAAREAAEALLLPHELREDGFSPAREVAALWGVARCWAVLRASGICLPTGDDWVGWRTRPQSNLSVPTDGRGASARLADLPDPFEPLQALFELGYGVRGTRDGQLQLVASLG